ncbi:MAG TPA: Stf0 family sulfotransferase, partial [Oscillatoriaceae cyanobacterium]
MTASIIDVIDPAFDVDNPSGTRPSVSYIICSTPRSGSSLLTEGLWSSGRMGIPAEYLNVVHQAPLAGRWGSEGLSAYLQALTERRTDRTGAFCLKVHWAQLIQYHRWFQQERGETPAPSTDPEAEHRARYRFLAETFPNPRFISISRLNRVRQAVSWYVAACTGEWARTAQDSGAARAVPPFNLDKLLAYLVALDAGEANWREFFRVNGVQPVAMLYEKLEEDFTAAIHELARAMD